MLFANLNGNETFIFNIRIGIIGESREQNIMEKILLPFKR